jgi:PAS domain S-box-containing protein
MRDAKADPKFFGTRTVAPRLALAVLSPVLACAIQWLLWHFIAPYVWFLFFPAAFFSAWVGGLKGGLVGTGIGALLVWYVFMPPQWSFALESASSYFSIAVFLAMGALFSDFFDRLQRAQRHTQTLFEAAFEQSGVGVALVDTNGRWLRVNRRLCEMVGYAPHELLARTFQDITHPDDVAPCLEAVQRMLAGEMATFRMEKRYVRRDGSVLWTNLTADLVRHPDGAPQYFFSIIEDLQGRKQTEAALLESENRYRELVENANSAIVHWTREGTITFFNEYAQSLFGWPAEAIIGQPVGILLPSQESTGSDLSHLVEDVATHPERFRHNINENVCRDGRRLWVSWTNRGLRDAQGRVTSILAVGNDITERVRAEMDLTQRSEELQRRNEELERFHDASVGRELEMVQLKGQVNALSKQLGRAPPFDLAFLDEPPSRDGSPGP